MWTAVKKSPFGCTSQVLQRLLHKNLRESASLPEIRSFSSPSSLLSFQDPALVWASHNRTVAESCLNQPPDNDNLKIREDDRIFLDWKGFEDYWRWRNWDFTRAEEADVEARTYGQNLATHVLSDPMTIAMLLLPSTTPSIPSTEVSLSNGKRHSLQLCCLGARAEALLPTQYWREILLVAASRLGWSHVDLTVDFVGPDIPSKRQRVRHSCSFTHGTVTVRWVYKGVFHEFLKKMENESRYGGGPRITASYWDAFVLFNPGIGHDNLRDDWKPTLDKLLSSEEWRRYPMLLTAHSWLDAQRDGLALTEYLLNEAPLYQKNPWASRIQHEDPFLPSHMVQSNLYYHVITV